MHEITLPEDDTTTIEKITSKLYVLDLQSNLSTTDKLQAILSTTDNAINILPMKNEIKTYEDLKKLTETKAHEVDIKLLITLCLKRRTYREDINIYVRQMIKDD